MPDLRRGVWYGIAAYALWGLFPLYWPLLKPSGAVEILAHRMLWSLAVVVVILVITKNWSWIRRTSKRQLLLLSGAGVLVSTNWGVYIYAVNSGHVVESALGYFINPLVSILFGVVILGRAAAAVAVGRGRAGRDGGGHPDPRLRAASLDRPRAGLQFRSVRPGQEEGPGRSGREPHDRDAGHADPGGDLPDHPGSGNTFGNHGAGHAVLLISSGVVTAVPLLFFAASVISVPLTIVGPAAVHRAGPAVPAAGC